MQPVSADFQAAVISSHTANTRVEAWFGGARLDPYAGARPDLALDLMDGAVTVDSTASVRRTYSATFAMQDWYPRPYDYAGIFSPYGTQHRVWRGVVYPDGSTEWVQLGVFRLDAVTTNVEAGTVQVTGSDLSKMIQDARFLQPTASVPSNRIPVEIARLVRGALGSTYPMRDLTSATTLTPAATWDRDRWQACQDLALAVGAEVVFAPDGQALIRRVPTITNAVSWTLDVADVVVTGDRAVDRSQTYNTVVATGERTDNVPPVRAVAQDLNPNSPTYVAGPYGVVPAFYSSPLLTTVSMAQAAADTRLSRTRGMARQLSFECVPNPAADAGDVLRVIFPDGSQEVHLVDTLQVPLHPSGTMRVSTRSSAEPGLE
jgi:hypothetical protein